MGASATIDTSLERTLSVPVTSKQAVAEVQPAIALAFDTVFAVLESNGWRESSEVEVIRSLNSDRPWAAAVIVGHGAEHCLALGGGWIALSSSYRLPGFILHPDAIRTPILMLYACGALRPPGAPCPESMHLATRLAINGTSVLGPFRNLRPEPAAACAFAEAIAAGDSLGNVQKGLDTFYKTPSFALLGNPEARTTPFRQRIAWPRYIQLSGKKSAAEASILSRAAATVALLTHLSTWVTPNQARTGALAALQRVRIHALKLFAKGTLSSLGRVSAELETATASALTAILDDLEIGIGQGRWLEASYAPVTRPAKAGMRQCPVCRGPARRTRHKHPGTMAVAALECDTCGSIEDCLGAPIVENDFDVRLEREALVCRMPALPLPAQGRVIIHRGGHLHAPWPVNGGEVRISFGPSVPRGRLTVAALAAAPSALHACYRHLWRPSA